MFSCGRTAIVAEARRYLVWQLNPDLMLICTASRERDQATTCMGKEQAEFPCAYAMSGFGCTQSETSNDVLAQRNSSRPQIRI